MKQRQFARREEERKEAVGVLHGAGEDMTCSVGRDSCKGSRGEQGLQPGPLPVTVDVSKALCLHL